MRILFALSCAVLLGGCEVANQAADQIARSQAKTVVNGVVADKFPGVNAAPITDCVIDNASAGEILSIASAAATGVTDKTVDTVLDIASRPGTVECITGAGLGLLSI